MRRIVAWVAVASLSSCSWILQDRAPANYSPARHGSPDCTTSSTLWILDAIFAVSSLAEAVLVGVDEEVADDDKPVIVGAGAIGALLHAASGASGASWARTCRDSHATFEAHEAQAWRNADERARREAPLFFCSISPTDSTIGVCAPTSERCAAARDKIAAEGGDAGPCAPAAAAVCFSINLDGKPGRGCAPTIGSCQRRRAAFLERNQGAAAAECADAAP